MMLQRLQLDRPLACFDIESTGTNPRTDRIIELAIIKLYPDGHEASLVRRVDPGVPIPPEVIAIHGITEADIEGCPPFIEIAPEIDAFLEDCDLGGYNLIRFDIPMLEEEFLRAGIRFDSSTRRLIDAQVIFHQREPRDLTAAVAFYCDGATHDGAHGAEADTRATLRVLDGQLRRYPDLPTTVEALDRLCNQRKPGWVDRNGRLKWQDGEVTINFGRKKGMTLKDLIAHDPNYIKWLLRGDFPRDTITIVQNAVNGVWPPPETDD